jgi:hypothetical protein
VKTLWQPQEGPQTDFCKTNVFEALIGGAAGGGKSDVLLHEALRQISHPQYRAIIFRRTNPQLKKLIDRSQETFQYLSSRPKWNDSKNIWKFPSGAEIKLWHMEHEKNKYDHDGQEYHYIGFDELTHFTETQYTYLISRCRTANPDIRCYVRASAMPIKEGIIWVKQRFIDNGPYKIVNDPDSGLTRQFIPAKLDDNKILMANDPNYEHKLKSLGTALYKALRYGDWDIIQGAAFDELNREIHMCKPHNPPLGAQVWRAMDWGFAKPFSIGWYYENSDKQLVRFKEWYGWNGKANTGLRMGAPEVARGIKKVDSLYNVSYGVADPAIWSKDDDIKSIADGMAAEGVHWVPAKNDRLQGKMEFHARLRGDNGIPYFKATEDCTHFWRTIPMLQNDERKPEDVDTKMEDHPYDEVRYMFMERPIYGKSEGMSSGPETVTAGMDW